MKRITKLAEDTGFKVSTEKNKATMDSRRKCPITTRPRMNIWAKGKEIEQVRQHRILGFTFYTRLEQIKNTKVRAEKKINIFKCLAHTTWGTDQGSLLKLHQIIVLGTLRYEEEAYGSATEAVMKKLEPIPKIRIKLALGAFAVSRIENVLCEAEMNTLAEITIGVVTHKEHPIRPFCTNPYKIDEYYPSGGTPRHVANRYEENRNHPTI
jgi:hypothetical protein